MYMAKHGPKLCSLAVTVYVCRRSLIGQVLLKLYILAGNIYAPGSTLGMSNVSIIAKGSAASGSGDQLLGSLVGRSGGAGVPNLFLGAANATTSVPQGGETQLLPTSFPFWHCFELRM